MPPKRLDGIRLLAAFVCFAVQAWANDVSIDGLIRAGLESAGHQDYSSAESLFGKIPAQHPAGPFFKCLLLQYRMIEEQDYRDGKSLYALCQATLDRSENLRKGKRAELFLYRGLGYGAMASYEEKTRSWISSILHGLKGISALEKSLELDDSMIDAYAGLGVYHYWKGKVTRFVRWFHFMDEREKGRRELRLAMNKGRYLNHPARYSLLWAYYAEGRTDSALALADGFLRTYPSNTIFLRARSDILFRMKDWKKAEAGYRRLLGQYKSRPTHSRIAEVECNYKRAVALEALGRRAEAIGAYRGALEIVTPSWARDLQPIRKRAHERLQRLEKKK